MGSSQVWILKSSLWNSSIFPKSAIDQMRYEQTNDVAEKLGLSRPTSSKYDQQPPYKKKKNFQGQPGNSQNQRQQNGSSQNCQQQNFRGQQQSYREGHRQKKGSKQKKKNWSKP